MNFASVLTLLQKALSLGSLPLIIAEVQKAEAFFTAGASAFARIRTALTTLSQRTGIQDADAVLSHPEFLGAIAVAFEQVANTPPSPFQLPGA